MATQKAIVEFAIIFGFRKAIKEHVGTIIVINIAYQFPIVSNALMVFFIRDIVVDLHLSAN
jgi:hypothetical protein